MYKDDLGGPSFVIHILDKSEQTTGKLEDKNSL